MMAEEKEPTKRHHWYWWVFLVLLIGGLSGGAFYFYTQYTHAQQMLKNPTLAAQAEAKELVSKVGKLMELPGDEQPTIATVSDVNKLKGQNFFKHARNGFKILIYPRSKKAILFDPINNKIIEVAPLNLGQPTASISASPTLLRVALYNGTTTIGLTTKVEKRLQDEQKNIQVVLKENAKQTAYEKSLVIDLTGKNRESAAQLAKFLHAQVSRVPEGEVLPPDADLLVILGKEE